MWSIAMLLSNSPVSNGETDEKVLPLKSEDGVPGRHAARVGKYMIHFVSNEIRQFLASECRKIVFCTSDSQLSAKIAY